LAATDGENVSGRG